MSFAARNSADGLEAPVRHLTVLYDDRCRSCRRWAGWLFEQRQLVPVELLPATSPDAAARYPHVEPWLGRELVVVDDQARVWVGAPAFVMCLWATARYRLSATVATRRAIEPVTNAFFRHLTERTHRAVDRSEFDECRDGSCEEAGWLFG